ncbi:heterokaryon incompatibility [Colletotrichum truncatum]|uniref:Heterokaryon incompatibility n=1 Tax=Colletotrichum truncatum TaxID=5467 RepID=A0ACC3YDF2_COLTU|nr:heterokaryon incompatibility [Colletotrichum truncatum]KAF6783079.1 heterokaryon incompatibility [Colletotrichum truncatum]
MTDSVKSAQALIEELQQNWEAFKAIGAEQPNSGGGIQSLLEEIVSKQLYSKETHFLLELIQNADDNRYIGVVPILDFTLRKDSLRIDCNEVGFTDSNVRALCSFGQSTKSGSAHHIGEKGIGFKSVFKVAATIYIHSCQFSFKFDGKQDLGNVTPIWCEFPAPVRHGHTSFLLELSEECDKTMITKELKALDRTMLLFLRQLKQINVVIDDEDGDMWQNTLSREDLKDRNNHVTRLWKNNTPSDYLIVHHKVENLPEMKQRPGCSSSEIVLGFPILNVAEKPKRTQMVHAFLPIRDYGFKFLLQGDFVLTANRQDIDDNAWNRTVRDGIADAFAIAVGCFNDFSGFLQYQWPYYLPGENMSDFFKPLINEIHLKLAHQPLTYMISE